MAERRMFAKSIIDSDMFLDMSLSTQALYFHLAMRADDDGFVSNPKRIMRMIGATDDEFKILVAKRYLIPFESGIVVIRHWKIHNYIQKDRYHPSSVDEKARLTLGKDKAYETLDTDMDTSCIQGCIQDCIQDGNIGKVRLGKVRLGKVRLGKVSKSVDTNLEKRDTESYPQYPQTDGQTDGLTDGLLNPIVDFYQSNIEILTPFKLTLLERYVHDYGVEWVEKAMEKVAALSADRRNIKYLGGVLSGWKKDNVPKPWEQERTSVKRQSARDMADEAIDLMEGGVFGGQ